MCDVAWGCMWLVGLYIGDSHVVKWSFLTCARRVCTITPPPTHTHTHTCFPPIAMYSDMWAGAWSNVGVCSDDGVCWRSGSLFLLPVVKCCCVFVGPVRVELVFFFSRLGFSLGDDGYIHLNSFFFGPQARLW